MNHIYLFPGAVSHFSCLSSLLPTGMTAYRGLLWLSYRILLELCMLYVDWELHRFYTKFVMTPALCRDLPVCLSLLASLAVWLYKLN